MRRVLVACLLASCGVRAPARMDIAAAVQRRGAVEVRRELTIRVLDDPRDVQARLALAELSEQSGRPSEAIEQLEAVQRLDGPLGTRWHDADRARLARLLVARGRARLARGAATAVRDLERARGLGATVRAEELRQARIAIALWQLRHVATKERAQGRATLAAEADARSSVATADAQRGEQQWRGARPSASPADRGAFGAWCWQVGARREAYEQLAAWHAATKPPRDEALQAAYLRALAWWSPIWLGEVPPPPAEDLVGPERCWFAAANCEPPVAPEQPLPTPPPLPVGADPRAAVAARYAASRASAVAPESRDVATGGSATATGLDAAALLPIATAFYRDAAIAERLARELAASAIDTAIAHATLGALFDALGDPARARVAWQAAVDASPEPAFVRGLAEAAARGGDGAAALVFATQAAAAWGDPAVVWTSVADALHGAGRHVEALTAARSALDLGGPEVLQRAIDLASAASRALGRTAQADAMQLQRAQLAPRHTTADAEAVAALAAHRERPTADTVARLWVASRTQPRDVELRAALVAALDADDPRYPTIVDELVALAGDADAQRAFAAVAALRR